MRDRGRAACETFLPFPLAFASMPLLDECQGASRQRGFGLLLNRDSPVPPRTSGHNLRCTRLSSLLSRHQFTVARVRPPEARHTASAVIVATAKSQTHALATL